MNIFETLNALDVSAYTEEKNGLTYLSWAHAWKEVKKRAPEANYEIVKNENGLPYFHDPATGYMVYTRVTIEGITHEMWLPVMDGANKAMKAEPYTYRVKNKNFRYAKRDADGVYRDRYGNEQPEFVENRVEAATMFDVNKAIMRCLTKNLAMFGLGLYIYAGEDLPEKVYSDPPEQPKEQPQNLASGHKPIKCTGCGHTIMGVTKGTTTWTADQIAEQAIKKFSRPYCYDCARKMSHPQQASPAEEVVQELERVVAQTLEIEDTQTSLENPQ